jgi:hypothetical protein
MITEMKVAWRQIYVSYLLFSAHENPLRPFRLAYFSLHIAWLIHVPFRYWTILVFQSDKWKKKPLFVGRVRPLQKKSYATYGVATR